MSVITTPGILGGIGCNPTYINVGQISGLLGSGGSGTYVGRSFGLSGSIAVNASGTSLKYHSGRGTPKKVIAYPMGRLANKIS